MSFTIHSECGPFGTISPLGDSSVVQGDSLTINFSPSSGYRATQILVDGVWVASLTTSYTFTNVQAAHAITVMFSQAKVITVSAGAHGTLNPAGPYELVATGQERQFGWTPDEGYVVDAVKVDGSDISIVSPYNFAPAYADHTFAITFIAIATHTITASAGDNGSIDPTGAQTVNEGTDKTFAIAADVGYMIADVLVDGVSVGAVSSYTFYNILINHTIVVSFAVIPPDSHLIETSGDHVTIDPSNPYVSEGADQLFAIQPDTGYIIADVLADGVSVGAVSEYTFTNVVADGHTLAVTVTWTGGSGGGGAAGMTGSGTLADPWIITTRAQLESLSDDLTNTGLLAEGHYYALGADINLAGENWVPIGTHGAYALFDHLGLFCQVGSEAGIDISHDIFMGNLDGQEYHINNMKVIPPESFFVVVDCGWGAQTNPYRPRIVKNESMTVYVTIWYPGTTIEDVLIDGISVGAVSQYTFVNVTAEHTMEIVT